MALKLDMSKTYDRVKWGLLEEVMRTIGFAEKWIGLIKKCISTVTYSIIVNG
jgi:hypothetical protein